MAAARSASSPTRAARCAPACGTVYKKQIDQLFGKHLEAREAESIGREPSKP